MSKNEQVLNYDRIYSDFAAIFFPREKFICTEADSEACVIFSCSPYHTYQAYNTYLVLHSILKQIPALHMKKADLPVSYLLFFYRLPQFNIPYCFTSILEITNCTEALLHSKQIGGSSHSSQIRYIWVTLIVHNICPHEGSKTMYVTEPLL